MQYPNMMTNALRRLRHARTAALITTLAALNGCGSTTDLSGIVSLDERNYETVSGKVVDTMQAVIALGAQGGATTDSVSGVSASAGGGPGVMAIAQDALQSIITTRPQFATPSVTGTSISSTIPCDKGNITVVQTQDGSGTAYSLTFNDCEQQSVNFTLAGSMNLTNVHYSGDLSVAATPGSMSAAFDLRAVKATNRRGSTTVQGVFDYNINTADGVSFDQGIRGAKLTITQTGDLLLLNTFDFAVTQDVNTAEYSYTASGSLYSTALGGSVTFNSNTAFTGTNLIADSPENGIMRIDGRSGSNVIMTAFPSGYVVLDVDTNGDGKVEKTRRTQWAFLR